MVGPHRLALFNVGLTDAELVDYIAALEYQRRDTRQAALVVMPAQHSMRRGMQCVSTSRLARLPTVHHRLIGIASGSHLEQRHSLATKA